MIRPVLRYNARTKPFQVRFLYAARGRTVGLYRVSSDDGTAHFHENEPCYKTLRELGGGWQLLEESDEGMIGYFKSRGTE